MKQDTVALYLVATIFGCCCCARDATAAPRQQLMRFPAAAVATGLTDAVGGGVSGGDGGGIGGGNGGLLSFMPTGRVAFRPHDSQEANERAVYDPGDELLRALNAEMSSNGAELGMLPQEPDYADTVFNELEVASKYDLLRKLEDDLREEQDIVSKSAILMKFLEDPNLDTLPMVYVEEDSSLEEPDNMVYPQTTSGMEKRSRYYRRYPWKRHNRHRSYEPELRYACTPSKEDVFKLLVGLHENRKGNLHKTVQFCNRKRPAKAIFTNIRFLG